MVQSFGDALRSPSLDAVSSVDSAAHKMPLALQLGMFWGGLQKSGGLDRVYTDLVRELPGAGFRAIGLVEGPLDAASLSSGAVALFNSSRTGRFGRYAGIRKAIQKTLFEHDVEVVGSHFALYARLALKSLQSKPLVAHFHGPWSLESKAEGESKAALFFKKTVEGKVYRRADKIIVLSEAFGCLAQKEFGVKSDRISVVPGCVDLVRFMSDETRMEARTRLGLPIDRPILLTVRRLKQRMGIDKLLDAMKDIVIAVPDVLLCIAGTGEMRSILELKVSESGLGSNVRFLGFVADDDLPGIYRSADLNVVPSLALEGFGLVAAEALAAGTPSMVTPVGGLPDVVKALSSDLVFDQIDARTMASNLIAALRGELNLPNSDVCRSYAREHFATSLAAQRTARVYRGVLR